MIRAGQLRRLSITVLAVLTIAVGAAQLIPGPDDPVRTPLPEAVGETAAVAEPGETTMAIRSALVDIQFGRAEDTHGWMHRVC